MKTMEEQLKEEMQELIKQEQAEREAVELSQFTLETTLIEKGVI